MPNNHATVTTAFTTRPARRDDAAEIPRLFLISSDGLAAYIWSRHQAPGQTLEAVGEARYARDEAAFSWRNCLLAVRGEQVLGMLHAFPMPAHTPGEAEIEPDPVLRPYAELEEPGSLYVAGLAVHAAFRGQGLGAALMERAHERARTEGLPRISLICFEANRRALAFYRRRGYREAARRPVVPHPSLHYTDGDALLLVRDAESTAVTAPAYPAAG